jgi:hypothetical protein
MCEFMEEHGRDANATSAEALLLPVRRSRHDEEWARLAVVATGTVLAFGRTMESWCAITRQFSFLPRSPGPAFGVAWGALTAEVVYTHVLS